MDVEASRAESRELGKSPAMEVDRTERIKEQGLDWY
jgi:hypothetical protein